MRAKALRGLPVPSVCAKERAARWNWTHRECPFVEYWTTNVEGPGRFGVVVSSAFVEAGNTVVWLTDVGPVPLDRVAPLPWSAMAATTYALLLAQHPQAHLSVVHVQEHKDHNLELFCHHPLPFWPDLENLVQAIAHKYWTGERTAMAWSLIEQGEKVHERSLLFERSEAKLRANGLAP